MRISSSFERTSRFSGLLWILPLCLLMCLGTLRAEAQDAPKQEKQITGKVVDPAGTPLSGVAVTVVGNRLKGAITNDQGDFLISAAPSDILMFSSLGFVTAEALASQFDTQKTFTLQPESQDIDEVVVVGYGTQKKVSVVGAITTLKTKDIESIPAPSISQALVGKIPGLMSLQSSGEPGQDQAALYIRGMSNWSNNAPIVIVDGIERDLNTLNMPEIESITFLKDATATAVYGIRGANGVIIITTKKGKVGAPVITLRSEFAQLKAMRFPDFLNAGEHSELWNEARMNDGLSPTYSAEQILRYYDGSDPYNYPNVSWINEVFKKTTFQTINNLNITGGTEKVRYFVNLGYTMQNGLFKRDSQFDYNTNVRMHRYNLRSNVDIQLAPSLIAEIGLGLISTEQKHPGYDTGTLLAAVFDYAPNKIPMRNPDGSFGATIFNNLTNPYMQATHGGYTTLLSNNMQGTFNLKWDLSSLVTKGLSWTNMFSFDQYLYGQNRRLKGITSKQYLGIESYGEDKYHTWFEKGPELYFTGASNSRALRFFSQLNYARSFGKHNVSSMFMFNMGESINLLAGDGTSALPSRIMGISGRAVYDYENRYIAEFSFGYNGSENFAPGHRYGFFPGLALGWNLAREKFWNVEQVSTLKFRGSVGKVGNDRTGGTRFAYLSTTGGATGYLFGENMSGRAGYTELAIGSTAITWEEATKINVGVDMGFWNDRLTFQVDAFQEDRDGLLVQRTNSTPQFSGFSPSQLPWANIGKTKNKGIEGQLEAKHTTQKGFFYSVRGNFAFTRSECVFRDEPVNKPEYQSFRNHPLGLSTALVAIGFFEDQDDIDNSPLQKFGPVRPGDVKYRDVNGDGVVDNLDQVMVGYPQVPEISYGFGFTLAYKGVDLSIYFTGAARSSYFFYGTTVYPFIWGNEANIQREFYEHRWRPGHDNSNAKYPAVSSVPSQNNNLISTLYMRDASYLRLKNAEVGYTLPQTWMQKINLGKARVFVNGIDLFLWDKLDIVDPEINYGSNAVYPKQRTINAGVEVTF